MSNEYRLPAARFLLAHALDSEIAEARTVAGGHKDSQKLIAWLNTPPAATIGKDAGGRPAVSAIDPGMWASYSQRHLFYVLRKLGEASERERQPEKREELREATAPFVTQLTLARRCGRIWWTIRTKAWP